MFTLGGGIGNLGQSLASRSGPAGDFFTGALACVVGSLRVSAVHGWRDRLRVHCPAAEGDDRVPVPRPGPGAAVPADRLRAGARTPPAQAGPVDGNAQARAGLPDVCHRAVAAWVLGKQRGVDGMALVLGGLLLLAFGLWLFERNRWTGSRR